MPEKIPDNIEGDSLFPKEESDSDVVSERIGGMKTLMHRALAMWFILCGVLSFFVAVQLWPESSPLPGDAAADSTAARQDSAAVQEPVSAVQDRYSEEVISQIFGTGREKRLLWISFLFGMLGGATHGFSSLMNFRGQRRLFRSWTLWYFGRPILGALMAVIFYIVVRAGLFNASSESAIDAINVSGVAAFSVLTGLFTDAAADKLRDLFHALFTPSKEKRGGKL